MAFSVDELHNLANLAYLEPATDEQTLAAEIGNILDFALQLNHVDTSAIMPLFHPMHLHQAMRDDEVTEESCLQQLAEIAPIFEESCYLVPKVIDTDKHDV